MTLFMQILFGQLKKMKKETYMSVLPHVNVPVEMSRVYDYGALAHFVDNVTIMCYDYRQVGSPPGPIAPFTWVEQNISTAINQGFKPSQICLGIATYGYDWPAGQPGGFSKPSRKILYDAAVRGYLNGVIPIKNPIMFIWILPASGEIWFETTRPCKRRSIWSKSINSPGAASGV